MKTIYKYPLEIFERQTLMLPTGAKILSVQPQGKHESVWLWALIDTEQPQEARTIVMRGTGHEFPEGTFTHLGTFQVMGGSLVFHVFEPVE